MASCVGPSSIDPHALGARLVRLNVAPMCRWLRRISIFGGSVGTSIGGSVGTSIGGCVGPFVGTSVGGSVGPFVAVLRIRLIAVARLFFQYSLLPSCTKYETKKRLASTAPANKYRCG